MNILLVSSFLPYPLHNGGHVRLFNIIKELSKNHSVTLVCEKRNQQTDTDLEEVKKICTAVYTVERKKQWSTSIVLKTAFSWYPFLMSGHTSSEMKKIISTLLEKNRYDLIHAETFYIMQNIPKTSVPVVLVEHNIEYLVYLRYLQTIPKFLGGLLPFLYFDIAKMKNWEERYWRQVEKLVAVSEIEQKKMKRADVVVVPNGVDTADFSLTKKEKKKHKKILFIGDFKWIQNQDSAHQIITQIWPKVKSQKGSEDLRLWIVGRKIPDFIKNLTKDSSVIFDENAPDKTSEIFAEADVLLAPIRVGGGTKFKVLEAMASGTPVVTTPLGIEGIDARQKEEVLIGDTPEELATLLHTITSDEKLYNKIQLQARKLIEKTYDWKMIVKKLEEVYESAVK